MPRKKKSASNIRPAAKAQRWGVDFLSTSPESPLVSADLIVAVPHFSVTDLLLMRLQKILSQPETWAQFSQEELEEIGATFPENVPRNANGSISLDWLRYNNDWRNAVRLWQDDLGAGRLDPEWLRQAAQAMEDRAAGKFDKFKEEEFEKFWGQKQKTNYQLRAGESGSLKLDDLIAGNVFREGDFWVYCRGFGRKPNRFDVIKDCKIVEIGAKSLTFAIPPGRLRYARDIPQVSSSKEAGPEEVASHPVQEDVILCTVETVRPLELKILEVDGRISNPTHYNPWKTMRVIRDNQDMGSLQDVRESFYLRTHPGKPRM